MKKILFLLLSVAGTGVVLAQNFPIPYDTVSQSLIFKNGAITFDSAVKYTMSYMLAVDPNDTTEGGNAATLDRWADFMGSRISNDVSNGENMFAPVSKALKYYMSNANQYCTNDPNSFKGDWKNVGPFINAYESSEVERVGRVDAIWVSPTDSNYILLGANSGGVWKTTDGGQNWANITDGTAVHATMGIFGIAVDSLQPDSIYVPTFAVATDDKSWGYGTGVYFSANGGQTWQLDDSLDARLGGLAGSAVQKIDYLPGSQKLYAIYHNKIVTKTSPSSAWADITPQSFGDDFKFTDFEGTRLNRGKAVFSTNCNGGHSSLWIYDDSQLPGSQWTELQITLPSPYTQVDAAGDRIQDISISPNDSVYILMQAHYHDTDVVTMIVKTSLDVLNVIIENANVPYRHIEASPSREGNLYGVAHNQENFYFSNNSGASFADLFGNTHGDGDCLYIYKSANSTGHTGDQLYGGTDGGIVAKRTGSYYLTPISGNGLCISQLYGFSNSEDGEDDVMMGGAQDNGGLTYNNRRTEKWKHETGGDNFLVQFAPYGIKTCYGEGNFPGMYKIDMADTSSAFPAIGSVSDACNPDPTQLYNACNNIQRPFYFDKDTNAYVGFRRVWKQPIHGTSWSTAFAADPLEANSDTVNRRVCDMVMSDNKDTVYIAYRGSADGNDPTGNPAPPSSPNIYAKLFVSVNAQDSSSIHWTNITPSAVAWDRIQDIETDPKNMARIWVALGDVNHWVINTPPDSMVNKVYYSDDYGQHWTDVSKGLPPLPINKILYQKGTDDVLFAGTDVGVFKWNKDIGAWTCFSNGMPPCFVTDMEFNYCAGKLRVATFGRGIWETPLFPSDDVPGVSDSITTNTTWSSSRFVSASVYVAPGHTLTISGDSTVIHMSRNAYIEVAATATLNVNDAKITNDCESCMWKGILGDGSTYYPQTSTYQSTITLNGATIEHARKGVCNFPESLPDGNWQHSGAIIHAGSTHFLNCCIGAELTLYEYGLDYATTPTAAYDARFINCTFEINDNYRGHTFDYPFSTHALLVGVQGVKFEGCQFYNRDNNNQNKGRGYGISCYDAGARIQSHCTSITTPCTSWQRSIFSGFGTGIKATGTLSAWYTVSVDGADFDSCTVGIKTDHFNNVATTHSTFKIGDGVPAELFSGSCHQNVGIWQSYSEIFGIEDNTFNGYSYSGQPSDMQHIGVIVEHSAIPIVDQNEQFPTTLYFHNEVYRNTFDTLTRACWALGPNAYGSDMIDSAGNSNGLVFKCNSYVANDSAIVVNGDSLSEGIAVRQGYYAQSAGNTFTNTSSKHNYIKNTARPIYYYFYGTGEHPSSLSPVLHLAVISASNDNSCNDHYSSLPWDNTKVATFKTQWNSLKSTRDSLVSEYVGLLDCGNTTALRAYMDTMTTDSATAVQQALLNCSPYLTKMTVSDAASLGILSKAQLKTVLFANPDLLHDITLLTFLQNDIPVPLSTGDVHSLIDSSTNVTERTYKLSDIEQTDDSLSLIANLLITNMKQDSTYADVDSIPVWLYKIGTIWTDYDIVGYYYSRNELDSALAVLDRIPAKYNFDSLLTLAIGDTSGGSSLSLSEGQAYVVYNHIGYKWLFKIISDVAATGRDIDSLTESEIDSLNTVAALDSFQIKAGKAASSLLNHLSPWAFPCAKAVITKNKTRNKPGRTDDDGTVPHSLALAYANAKAANNDGNKYTKGVNALKVYPNPANEYVVFEYNAPSAQGALQLVISDTRGVKVKQFALGNTTGQVRWETRTLVPGVYFYKLTDSKQVIKNGKVTVIR